MNGPHLHHDGEDPFGPGSYFHQTRRPIVCLAFLAPLLAAYEVGVIWLASRDEPIHGGAGGWLRQSLAETGAGAAFALPAVVAAILLGWNFYGHHRWEVRWDTLGGMLGESLLAASLLVGAAFGTHALLGDGGAGDAPTVTVDLADDAGGAPRSTAANLVGAVGAGVYEELLFRLALLPLAYGLFRLLRCGPRGAAALAVVSSSLLFALCHHLGPQGEVPTLGPFLFRAGAGGVLAALFWWRGFGVAVGAHAAYDLIAGVLLAG
ncbi:type II CAAX prenyl endopeptidase Rce1 family protein [Alienimonas sp. DA493]|uniref:CPBP family glutamic-type intramembrane protease n=1 Tax=Alienimonas sp. DA493 TaxID=3373605 RepID=UPI003754F91A